MIKQTLKYGQVVRIHLNSQEDRNNLNSKVVRIHLNSEEARNNLNSEVEKNNLNDQQENGIIIAKGFLDPNAYYMQIDDLRKANNFRDSLFTILPRGTFELLSKQKNKFFLVQSKKKVFFLIYFFNFANFFFKQAKSYLIKLAKQSRAGQAPQQYYQFLGYEFSQVTFSRYEKQQYRDQKKKLCQFMLAVNSDNVKLEFHMIAKLSQLPLKIL